MRRMAKLGSNNHLGLSWLPEQHRRDVFVAAEGR
jgi:hypothetical protein